MKSNKKV